MGEPTSSDLHEVSGAGDTCRRRTPGAVGANLSRYEVIDALPDSFPLLPGESQWLMALLADDLARILADD